MSIHLEDRVRELEAELERTRGTNETLRNEVAELVKQLAEARRIVASGTQKGRELTQRELFEQHMVKGGLTPGNVYGLGSWNETRQAYDVSWVQGYWEGWKLADSYFKERP